MNQHQSCFACNCRNTYLVLVAKANLTLDFFICHSPPQVKIDPFYCACIINFLGVSAFLLQISLSKTDMLWDMRAKEFLQWWSMKLPLGVSNNLKMSPGIALWLVGWFSLGFPLSNLLISLGPLCFYLHCLQQWCYVTCSCRFFMRNWKNVSF